MLDQPDPKLVRVGVKNRGCAGLAYHLEYVDKAGKFDEVVEQDGQIPYLFGFPLMTRFLVVASLPVSYRFPPSMLLCLPFASVTSCFPPLPHLC